MKGLGNGILGATGHVHMVRLISGIGLGFGLGDIITTVMVQSWDIGFVGFRRMLGSSWKAGLDIAA